MNPEELQDRYERLRRELDAAYSAVQWDARRIDLITEQMLPLERALSMAHARWTVGPGERALALPGPAGGAGA